MKTKYAAAAAASALACAFAPSAHATFVIDTACDHASCPGEVKFFNDSANKDVTTFTGTVGGHKGQAVTVTTSGPIDSGAGFSNITPAKASSDLLTTLTFTPASDTLFGDFSFRGQLEPAGFGTGQVDIIWTDSLGTTGTLTFDVTAPDEDFGRFGIVSHDGETLKSVEIMTPLTGESFKEVKEIGFSGAGVLPTIPEPSTWAMMALGFASLGFVAYRRNRKSEAAIV
jgi:hypothetical protein